MSTSDTNVIAMACSTGRPVLSNHANRLMLTTADQTPPVSSSTNNGRVKMPALGLRGFRCIRSGLWRIDRQRERRQAVGRQVDVEDLHGRERQRQTRERGAGHQQNLPDVRREQVRQILLDVGEDDAAFFDRRDNRREVVVEQRDGRGFLADVRASDAHRDPDVGLLERGSVVHAVSGHRDDVPSFLPCRDHSQLVGRRHARVDADVANVVLQFCIGHRLEIVTGDDAAAGEEPELPGDGLRRRGMIARDHDGLDAGVLTGFTAARASGRGGSMIPTRPSSVMCRSASARDAVRFLRNGQDAQPVTRHPLFDVSQPVAIRRREKGISGSVSQWLEPSRMTSAAPFE